MNKKQLWETYIKKNPQFDDPEAIIKIKGSGLKKMFDQTYDLAYKEGFNLSDTFGNAINKAASKMG